MCDAVLDGPSHRQPIDPKIIGTGTTLSYPLNIVNIHRAHTQHSRRPLLVSTTTQEVATSTSSTSTSTKTHGQVKAIDLSKATIAFPVPTLYY